MTEKPNDGDLRYAMDSTQDSRFQSIRILRQYRLWADEQIAQLQERNANQAKSVAELREETDNLRDDNAKHRNDYRLRGEQLAELTAERDNFRDQANAAINRQIELREQLAEAARVNDRQQQAISRQVDLREALRVARTEFRRMTRLCDGLYAQNAALIDEIKSGERSVSKPSTALHEYAETAFAKKNVPLDKEVQVIADCLSAMDELDASKRSSIAQYLLSRAQTTAWLNLPQAPAQQAGGQW